MKFECPACHKPIHSRRNKKCAACGKPLPEELLLTPEAIEKIDASTDKVKKNLKELKEWHKEGKPWDLSI